MKELNFAYRNIEEEKAVKEFYNTFEDQYFNQKKVNANNEFYVHLLKYYLTERTTLFKLNRQSYNFRNQPMTAIILNEANYFKNDTLKELGRIAGLHTCYERISGWGKVYTKSDLNSLADSLLLNLTYPAHRKILSNIIAKYNALEVGDEFPVIELLNQDSVFSSIAQYRGKKVLVDFWATWRGPCIKAIKEFPNLLKKMEGELVIVSISVDEKYETMEKFAKKHHYDWEFLHNGIEGNYIDSLIISGYPTYFVLDEKGKTMILEAYQFEPNKDLPNLLK